MVIAWTLTVAGFIIIFVDVGGWVSESVSENPHPLIGCITTGNCPYFYGFKAIAIQLVIHLHFRYSFGVHSAFYGIDETFAPCAQSIHFQLGSYARRIFGPHFSKY